MIIMIRGEGQPIPAIISTGEYFPKRRVSGNDVDTFLNDKKQGFTDRAMRATGAGIENRHWVEVGESAVSILAAKALTMAIETGGLQPRDIDYLWLATTSTDVQGSSTAPAVGKRAQLREDITGSVNADACPGWINAAYRASTSLTSPLGQEDSIHAVVGAEVISPFLSKNKPKTAILFGDGAGATIWKNVKSTRSDAVLGFSGAVNGELVDALGIKAGGSALPTSTETLEADLHTIDMDQEAIGREAILVMPRELLRAMKNADPTLQIENIDRFVFHQANLGIIKAVADILKIPLERCVITIPDIGNTSAASIPTAIHRGIQRGQILPHQIVGAASFGAGTSSAGMIMTMEGLSRTA